MCIRDSYTALGLCEEKLFLELLSRDEQKASRELVSRLDQKVEGYSPAVLFYPIEHEVEEMIEVVEGSRIINLLVNCCYSRSCLSNRATNTESC